MSESRAFDMGRFQRIVAVESPRITGSFTTNSFSQDGDAWVSAQEVTIWSEDRRWGRTLYSNDLKGEVVAGVAELREHMIASNKLAEVQEVWEEMKATLVAVAAAAAYQEGDSAHVLIATTKEPE